LVETESRPLLNWWCHNFPPFLSKDTKAVKNDRNSQVGLTHSTLPRYTVQRKWL